MTTLKHRIWIAFVAFGIASVTLVISAQQPKPASAMGIYSDGQALRGAAIYAENCAQCHTPTLEGGELAPALTGPSFVARWTAGKPLSGLFDYMRSEMPL